MTEAGKRAQRSEESRKRILEATLELAATRGYEGTTIGKVSERSGLPTGSVYWHFESKDKLFGALLEQCVTEWEARQHWSHEGQEPSRERFEKLIALRAAEAASPASFWRLGILLALERRLSGTVARETFLQIRRTRLADIAGWWEHLLPARVREADPGLARRLAQFTMATADGLCVAGGAGEDWDHGALAGMLIDALRHLVDDAVAAAGPALRTVRTQRVAVRTAGPRVVAADGAVPGGRHQERGTVRRLRGDQARQRAGRSEEPPGLAGGEVPQAHGPRVGAGGDGSPGPGRGDGHPAR